MEERGQVEDESDGSPALESDTLSHGSPPIELQSHVRLPVAMQLLEDLYQTLGSYEDQQSKPVSPTPKLIHKENPKERGSKRSREQISRRAYEEHLDETARWPVRRRQRRSSRPGRPRRWTKEGPRLDMSSFVEAGQVPVRQHAQLEDTVLKFEVRFKIMIRKWHATMYFRNN